MKKKRKINKKKLNQNMKSRKNKKINNKQTSLQKNQKEHYRDLLLHRKMTLFRFEKKL